jgi:hypothetical protein
MLTRRGLYLHPLTESAPLATEQLERDGYVLLRDGLCTTDQLRADVDQLFAGPDTELQRANDGRKYRYVALNRSARVQELVGNQVILQVVEPLLGEDCHVIANTAWRNPAGRRVTHGGRNRRCEARPYIQRPATVPWPDKMPGPLFVLAVQVLPVPKPVESGSTGVIPGNHRSGQAPPGDRRDIAQRLWASERVHQLSPQAAARAGERSRARTVVGPHEPFFCDG